MYTVKELADLAGITRRTLHYYDEKGLLKPSMVGEKGYRFYDDTALLRLQQILFYREMDLELSKIKLILDDPDFEIAAALRAHRKTLSAKIQRLNNLTSTVDATLMHLMGEIKMKDDNMFQGFSDEQQKEYEKEALERWGDTAEQSIKLWNSYSEQRKSEIKQEGSQIYQEIVANMDKGAGSLEIQALLSRWHQHLRNFYEPSPEMLAGLGKMYRNHPDFNAVFTKIDPRLPAFLDKAIGRYVESMGN